MPAGSPRPNAGRPKGAVNRKTTEAIKATEATGQTPLEYMLLIMRDSNNGTAERLDAAKAAAPYVHARLTTIDANVKGDLAHTVRSIERRIVDPANPNG